MPSHHPSIIRVVSAGALLLLVVHGLGRFVYTPLMPRLVADGQLALGQAADIASWNYVGYLLGALLAIRWATPAAIHRAIPWALALHCVTLLSLTQSDSLWAIGMLRLGNGISNGMVFVLVPALILEWLAVNGRIRASGLIYLGVGLGLLLSSALVSLGDGWLTGAARWWPAALLSIPLGYWSWLTLSRLPIPPAKTDHAIAPKRQALFDRHSQTLFFAYAGAGLGYILPMTFLPMLASLQLGKGSPMVSQSWLIVSIAALPSTWLWNRLGSQFGDRNMLICNYALQLLGVLCALLLPPQWGLALCSLLIGGCFLGAVLLTQRLARSLQPTQGPRLSAALIALYGFTQLIGPWLVRVGFDYGITLQGSLWFGAAALLISFICMLKVADIRH
ncbi:YbfB/YjiJ family MFS transporter [Halopseudomonas pelagia]|mgnify:CR=1 FL=1|uniref:YbfB/YjiJ family MFS transporter n=1 Tax=Halopseudomonas pelagia TaxID=553151 RepID=UPI0003B2EA9A|nr:YbfB/YjiJ family MFS transporter [Halopseudomonas pelagia]